MGAKFPEKRKKDSLLPFKNPQSNRKLSVDMSSVVQVEDRIYTVFFILLISLVTCSVSLRHSNGSEPAICIRCQELLPGFVKSNMLDNILSKARPVQESYAEI